MMIKFNKRNTFHLLIYMVFAFLVVVGISILMIFNIIVSEHKQYLKELSDKQIALVNSLHSGSYSKEKIIQVLNKQSEFHKGLRKTGELFIANKKNDTVFFLICHRQLDFQIPNPIPYDSLKGIPLKNALSKSFGFVIAADYNGRKVLAYMDYIPELEWAIVTKINYSEIMQVFYGASIYVFIASIVLILISVFIFMRILSERKKKEAKLEKLNRTLMALSESSKAMMHANDEGKYLEDVCKIIVEDCGHKMVWIGFAENDALKTVKPSVYAGFEKGYLDTLNISWDDNERGQGPTGTAIRTGKPSFCRNMLTDPKFKPWREEAIKRGYASSLVIPLLNIEGIAFGAINIYSKDPDPFSEDEVHLLTELTNDLAYGILAIRLRLNKEKAEESLRTREEEYRLLFNSMIDGFALHEIILDKNMKPCDYRFLSINPAFEKLTGFKADNIIGKSVLEVMPATEKYWIKLYGDVALTGKNIEFENYSAEIDKYFKVNAFSPKKGFFAVIFEDITQKKIADDQLKKYAADLKDLNATKDKFFGIIAHDLKNPFCTLLGASELLALNAEGMSQENIKSISSVLHESAKRGYELLENLLDWSRSQTGNIKFEPQELNLAKLVAENVINMEAYSNNKKIKLKLKVADNLFAMVDKNMFNTILRNLLHNAVKFTHQHGKVSVLAETNNNEVVITVEDSGIGIKKENLDKLFRIDVPFSNLGTANEKGTGLGLLLCKEFVEQQGGKIWVESEPGKGSRFMFSFPTHIEKRNIPEIINTFPEC